MEDMEIKDRKIKQACTIAITNIEEAVDKLKGQLEKSNKQLSAQIEGHPLKEVEKYSEELAETLQEVDKKLNTQRELPKKIIDVFTEQDKELIEKTEDHINRYIVKKEEIAKQTLIAKNLVGAGIVMFLIGGLVSTLLYKLYLLT